VASCRLVSAAVLVEDLRRSPAATATAGVRPQCSSHADSADKTRIAQRTDYQAHTVLRNCH
jgi:hypothetical protein